MPEQLPLPPSPRTPWDSLPTPLRRVLELGLNALDDYEFEQFVAEAFRVMGYEVKTTPRGADEGVDIFLTGKDLPGLCVVQCKHWKQAVGVVEIREFYGVMAHFKAVSGLYVCSTGVTEAAKKFLKGKAISLLRPTELAGEIVERIAILKAPELVLKYKARNSPKPEQVEPKEISATKTESRIIIPNSW
ncbi:MAG TPA: restriction endonuclease [Candidatus Eisenbacteria bacterium]|nr:restriction endonuclease [Candidatus Eisenbacteria bacterium]